MSRTHRLIHEETLKAEAIRILVEALEWHVQRWEARHEVEDQKGRAALAAARQHLLGGQAIGD